MRRDPLTTAHRLVRAIDQEIGLGKLAKGVDGSATANYRQQRQIGRDHFLTVAIRLIAYPARAGAASQIMVTYHTDRQPLDMCLGLRLISKPGVDLIERLNRRVPATRCLNNLD